jgi:hypothetical protein
VNRAVESPAGRRRPEDRDEPDAEGHREKALEEVPTFAEVM